MSRRPFISVIIPTCRREQHLLQCVRAIADQGFDNYELLVVDQNPERTLERQLENSGLSSDRVRYFYLERAGSARARNFGIHQSHGEILAFIDDDALAGPLWLASIAETFAMSARPALMGGPVVPIWEGGRPHWLPKEKEYMLGLYDIGNQAQPMPPISQPMGANMAGVRRVIIENGAFDEQFGYNYFRKRPMLAGEDTILSHRIRRGGHLVYYHPGAAVRHRMHKKKLSRRYFLKRHFWEGVTTAEMLHSLGELEPDRGCHSRLHRREAFTELRRACSSLYGFPAGWPPFMLALSNFSYNVGIVYGIKGLEAGRQAKCASV